MGYSCYVRHEGRGLVTVQPTVTIQFDQITTITRNRLRRVFQDNYSPYGWSSKINAVLDAMQGHYEVLGTLLAPALMNHPDFDQEMFAAKALLLGYTFTVLKYDNPKAYRNGYGNLKYTGDKNYDERPIEQIEMLTLDTLLPVARKLINHNKLAPIMEALESRQPYTFTGINMR